MKKAVSTLLIITVVLSVLLVFTPKLKVLATTALGKALDFDGIDDYVGVADSPNLRGMTELTLEAWIKPDTFPQYASIIGKWAYSVHMQYILGYFSGGKMYFWVGTDTTADSINVTQPSLGVWTHVVAVFKGSISLEVFYNGVSQGSKPTTIANIGIGIEPLCIGKYAIYNFDGAIDEVRIYNRTLSAPEILAHYNSGTGQYGRPETDLMAGWHFDEDIGTTTGDYSSNGHNGIIYGATWTDGHVQLPDVAITSVVPTSTKVISGDSVDIHVSAQNLGTQNEDFTVTAYYNSSVIGIKPVTNLAPSATIDLTFTLNTSGVPLGTYAIKAMASAVQGEINTANNEKSDGNIWIVQYPAVSFTYSPVLVLENSSASFDATASDPRGGSIVNYTWNFDDGNITTTSSPTVSHVYASHGTYNVTLKIWDSEDLSNNTWQLVVVQRHDVAIIDVTPYRNWTYEGRIININVTAANFGNFTETATIKLYYNITADKEIGTKDIVLNPSETKTLTFAWNTTGVPHCQNYTITATITIAEFDSNTTNNMLESPTKIKIRIIGDINNDDKVNILDVYGVAQCFGKTPDRQGWNPDADINDDGKIDIKDFMATCRNYGIQ